MHAKVFTCAVVGLDGVLVEVEVDIARQGLANFQVVGLPDAAVQEARERVRAAIKNSGLVFPYRRMVVGLAPAELRKSGPSYDLPIAVGILLASGQLTGDFAEVLFLGELALDGSLRHTHGILPMGALAREQGLRRVFVPGAECPMAIQPEVVEDRGDEGDHGRDPVVDRQRVYASRENSQVDHVPAGAHSTEADQLKPVVWSAQPVTHADVQPELDR